MEEISFHRVGEFQFNRIEMKRLFTVVLMMLGCCLPATKGYSQSNVVNYAYFDPFSAKGYEILNTENLGKLFFQVNWNAKGRSKTTMWLNHQPKFIANPELFSLDTTYHNFYPGRSSSLIEFVLVKQQRKVRATYIKVHTTKRSKWELEFWKAEDRSSTIKVAPINGFKNLRTRTKDPALKSEFFQFPDTNNTNFRLWIDSYQYIQDTIEWNRKQWLIDNRISNTGKHRVLEYHEVWRFVLPVKDPFQVVGAWGLTFFGLLGENILKSGDQKYPRD
jgi:hypothetical protein